MQYSILHRIILLKLIPIEITVNIKIIILFEFINMEPLKIY